MPPGELTSLSGDPSIDDFLREAATTSLLSYPGKFSGTERYELVRRLGSKEAIARFLRVLEHHEVRRAAALARSALLVPGAIDDDRDVGWALQELLQVAALKEDVAVEEQERAGELLGGAEEREGLVGGRELDDEGT